MADEYFRAYEAKNDAAGQFRLQAVVDAPPESDAKQCACEAQDNRYSPNHGQWQREL